MLSTRVPIHPANLRRKNRFSSLKEWSDTSREVSSGEKTLVGRKSPLSKMSFRNVFPLIVMIVVSLIGQASAANLQMNTGITILDVTPATVNAESELPIT